jgi:rhamnose transport system ATP-binding protein
MSTASSRPLVELRGVSRSYGGVQALSDVSFAIDPASTHALVGENGAGKSTLVKILTGVVAPDAGEVIVDGEPRHIGDPMAAHRLGIVAMYQEPTVFEDLTVAENVFAGRYLRSGLHTVDWRAMRRESARILEGIGADFAPDAPVRGLGVADRQLIEIAKALSSSARLLIMDEPTAALSLQEVDNLFATVRRLHERGVAVLFISHRLEEVSEIADVVTVLRDGQHVATRPAAELSHGEMIRLMVGRSLEALFPKEEAEIGEPVFRAQGLTRRGVFSDVSFELRRGEIVGLAGFVGSGRTEIARAIFGIDKLDELRAPVAEGGSPPRARVSARGPPPAGPRPAHVGGAEHVDGRADQAGPGRDPAPLARTPARPRLHGAAPHQGDLAGAGRQEPLRRKSAEGRPLEVACRPAEDPDPR